MQQLDLPLFNDPEAPPGESPQAPGAFIQSELTKRGWAQADLAEILGRPLPAVNEIIKGRRAITPEMAICLGRAFGTSAELWIHREAAYRLSLADGGDSDTVKKAQLYEMAPITEMTRRGWITPHSNTAESIEKSLLAFIGKDSLDGGIKISAVARQSAPSTEFSNAQLAWLLQAERIASLLNVKEFSDESLAICLEKLKKLRLKPESAANVPAVLANAGIRLVIVERLPRTRIDGAAFYLDGDPTKPVIVLSLRIDSMDSFWFTLAHELVHIVHRDPFSVDVDLVGDDLKINLPEIETRANQEGAEWLVPSADLTSFIRRAGPYYSLEKVTLFATRMGVHPSIVIGQLQHRKVIEWSRFASQRPKVRDHIIAGAMTDGFGRSVNFPAKSKKDE